MVLSDEQYNKLLQLTQTPEKDKDVIVSEVATRLGVPSDWVNNVINFESMGGNPSAKNPRSSAKGLIQFTDDTAQKLGYGSSHELITKNPTIESQMWNAVYPYLSQFKPKTEEELYLSVFYPAAIGGNLDQPFPQNVQHANPGIKTPRDYINKVKGVKTQQAFKPLSDEKYNELLSLLEKPAKEAAQPEAEGLVQTEGGLRKGASLEDVAAKEFQKPSLEEKIVGGVIDFATGGSKKKPSGSSGDIPEHKLSFRERRDVVHQKIMDRGEFLNQAQERFKKFKMPIPEWADTAKMNKDDKFAFNYYRQMESMKGGTAFLSSFSGGVVPFSEKLKTGVQKKAEKEAPIAATTGKVAGTITAGVLGSNVISSQLAKVPGIKDSANFMNLLTRMSTAGAVSAGQQDWKNNFKESLKNTLVSTGAGAVSIIPEIYAPAGVWQLGAQPLADVLYDAAIDKMRGKEVVSVDFIKRNWLNWALSEGFAIKDVASGVEFKATQATQRAEINNFIKKHGNKGFEVFKKAITPKQKETAEFLPGGEERIEKIIKAETAREKAKEKITSQVPVIGKEAEAEIVKGKMGGMDAGVKPRKSLEQLGKEAEERGTIAPLEEAKPDEKIPEFVPEGKTELGYPSKIVNKKFLGGKTEKPVFTEEFNNLEPAKKYKALKNEKKLIDDQISKLKEENTTVGIVPLELLKKKLTKEQSKYTTYAEDKNKREQAQVNRWAESGKPDTKLTEQIHSDLNSLFKEYETNKEKNISELNNILKGDYSEETIAKAIDAIKKGEKDGKAAEDIRKEVGGLLATGTTPKQVADLTEKIATDFPFGENVKYSEETKDVFEGTEHEDTRTIGQKKLAEEIKLKEKSTVGGKADVEGLPFFEGGAGRVAGTEQKSLFEKKQKVAETTPKLTPEEELAERVKQTAPPKKEDEFEYYRKKLEGVEIEEPKTKKGVVEAGSLAYGKKLPKKVLGVNLKKIINEGLDRSEAGEEAYDIKKFALDIADEHKQEIWKARKGVVSHKETQAAADALGMKESNLIKSLGRENFAAKIKAAQDIYTESAIRNKNKINKILAKGKNEITDNDRSEILLAIARHATVTAAFSTKKAEAGRAVEILKTVSSGIKGGDAIKAMDVFNGKAVNEGIIEKLIEHGKLDEEIVGRLANTLFKPTTFDMINEVWINFILSGPPTHVANITGNAIAAAFKPLLETPAAASIEAIRKGKNREIFFRQGAQEIVGTFQGIPEGVKNALKAWKTEKPIDAGSKLETLKYKSIPGKAGKKVRIPSRALLAMDEFFKAIVKQSYINSESYRQARIQARNKKLSSEEFIDLYARLKTNPSKKMLADAKKEARYRAFQKELGEDILSKGAKTLISARQQIPVIKFVFPFIKTPTNVARFTLERGPLGFVDKIIRISKGEITGKDISEELAKPMVGSMLAAAAVILTTQGFITGAGPKEKEKRYALYRTGWQPYSFKIGDKYWSYARLEPFGSIIGMAADFATLKKDSKDLTEIASRIAYSFGRNITSKTYMQGLAKLIDALYDWERYGDDFINNFAGSLIPNIIAKGASATDKELKQVDNLRDIYYSRTPGLRGLLYPKRDIWGRAIVKEGNFFTEFISPIQYSAAKNDPVDLELVRLEASIRNPNKKLSLNDELRNKYGIKDKKIEMSPKEYDWFQKIAGEKARYDVEKLMNSVKYSALSDEAKLNKIESIINSDREDVRNRMKTSIIARYKSKTK